jgi:hypothetical protein
MKTIFRLSLLMFLQGYGFSKPLNVNSVGYVMGELSEIGRRGATGEIIEGDVLLGRESSRRAKK